MNPMGIRVLMAGGGTGGHTSPAIAIADEIRNRFADTDIRFVGTVHGLEMRLVPRAGYPLIPIPVIGLRRSFSIDLLRFPFLLFAGLIQSLLLVERFRPALVICTGGYVSGPAGIAAWLRSIPLVVQEQNLLPGITNRILSRMAAQVHLAFPSSIRFFRSKISHVSGNPTRMEIGSCDQVEARIRLNLEPDITTLLIFCGSQGARSINLAVGEALRMLLEGPRLQVLWQTGKLDFERVQKEARPHSERVTAVSFIDDVAAAFAAADLAITRAGATTIAELTRCGLPAVLIPLPSAAADHQTKNASALVKGGAARMIPQGELDGDRLATVVQNLLDDPAVIRDMASRMQAFGVPDAASRIVDTLQLMRLIPS